MESGQVCCLAQQWCDGGGAGGGGGGGSSGNSGNGGGVGGGSEGIKKIEKGSFNPCDDNGQMLNGGGSGVGQGGGGEKVWHRWHQVYFSVDNYKIQSGYLYC